MNKTDFIQKVKALEGLSQDERAYLINLVNTKKKYGLVWEDKPEDVEEQLRKNLPVLREVVEKRIMGKELPEKVTANKTLFDNQDNITNPKNHAIENYPNHILIEGDNLHALTALTFTHEGKIDVIYIDPPYNTGNKDFKYNDSFVDKEDGYKHSKWISFMHKRLQIAKRLLSNKGVIFISIDDNEQAQLKLLCDEIFIGSNFIDNIIWEKVFAPKNDAKYFSASHDFILVFAKNKLLWNRNLLPRTEEMNARYSNPDSDSRGPWTSGDCSVKTYSANTDYPITTPSGRIVNPPKGYCWRFNKEKFQELVFDNRIWFGANGENVPRFKRFLSDVQNGIVPITIWKKEEVGHNQDAKQEMNSVLHNVSLVFDTPKPTKLLDRILKISTDKDNSFTILDFFAGSGTTLHATMQLNAEDGGNRQCILVTNNENNICEEVTYERNKRVIQGYTNAKGVAVAGLTNNNLRYYKSEFVSRDASIKNKKEITKLATELLCIKEDIYAEQKALGNYQLNAAYVKCFKRDNLYLLVIYDEEVIEQMVEVIQHFIMADKQRKTHFKVYVFSNGQYPYTEEFEEVLPYVTLCALPDAIYKAYQNVLPKRQRKSIPVLEESTAESVEHQLENKTADLFNQQ